MCGPLALMIGGSVLGGAAKVASGVAQNQAALYRAKVEENNAKLAEEQAAKVKAQGDLEIVRQQRQLKQHTGGRSALIGASGIEHSGSAEDVLVAEIEQGRLDSQILAANFADKQQELIFDAKNLRTQAKLTRASGRNALFGSVLSAGGSILSGASQAIGTFGKKADVLGSI